MMRDKCLSFLQSMVLSFLLGCSGVFCLVTAFSMTYVDTGAILLWSLAAAVLFSACFTWKLGLVPICLLAFVGGYLWRQGSLAYSVEALVNALSARYAMGYNWPVIAWSGRELAGVDLTPALCAISLLVILVTAWTVCRRMPAMLAVLFAIVPVCCCVVVTDTVPKASWLFVFFLALSVLLISQLLRRRSMAQGNLLTALVTVPVLAALALLFWTVPQENYGQLSGGTVADTVSDWVEDIISGSYGSVYLNVSGGAVNLTHVGSRKESEAVVMEVTTDYEGTLYLRSYSYDTYYANYWTNGGEDSTLPWPEIHKLDRGEKVDIITTYVNPKVYMPYYCEEMVDPGIGRGLDNWKKTKEFSYRLWNLPQTYFFYESPFTPRQEYTSLPEDTQQWAREMLTQITDETDSAIQIAADIRKYVSSCADYDLNARRMPARYDDFAYWFLTEADEGYCVHFATAATVLLRAAGIPARYVTGYLVNTQAGETVAVRGKNAHAWVEYWVEGFGWLILEPTPARQIEQIAAAEPAPPVTTEAATVPEETVEAMATTAPDTGTAPTEPQPQTQPKDEGDPDRLWNTLQTIGYSLAALAAILLQWKLRLWLRRRTRSRGSVNSRAVSAWREAVFLARLLGEKPDKGLFALAQKAKFSQHTLEPESLTAFEGYIARAVEKLKKKPLLLRLAYRLIFAAY